MAQLTKHTQYAIYNNFGFHDKEPIVHLRTKDAVTEWFNYAGLTYIAQ